MLWTKFFQGSLRISRTIQLIGCIVIVGACSCIAGGVKGKVKTSEGGLGDAVVYIEKIEGKTFSSREKPSVVDQLNLVFVPHVLPVLAGTTIVFPNSDSTRHSVFSPSKVKKFDLGTYLPNSTKTILCEKPGVISLLCHIHPEMSAFIIVVETPYFAVTSETGQYRIPNIPAGRYRLAVWHEWAESQTQEINVPEGGDVTINFLLK
jgi:plastocyanin